jgi:hypothetical protein
MRITILAPRSHSRYPLAPLGKAVVGTLAGAAATMQNYRYSAGERPRPRWVSYGMTALTALAVGAIVSSAIPQPEATGVDAKTLDRLPALAAQGLAFDQTEVHAQAGATVVLRLDNFDRVEHQFDIDAIDVHVVMPTGKRGIALFSPTRPPGRTRSTVASLVIARPAWSEH